MKFFISNVIICVGLSTIVQSLPSTKKISVTKSSSLIEDGQKFSFEDVDKDEDGQLYLNKVPLSYLYAQVFQNTLEEEDYDYWEANSNEFYERYQENLEKQKSNPELSLYEKLLMQSVGSILFDGKIISEEELEQVQNILSKKSDNYWKEHPDQYLKQLAEAVQVLRQSNSTVNTSQVEKEHSHKLFITQFEDVYIDGEKLSYHETLAFYEVYVTKKPQYWDENQNELVLLFLEHIKDFEREAINAINGRFHSEIYYNGQQLTLEEKQILYFVSDSFDDNANMEDMNTKFVEEVKKQQGFFKGPISNNTSIAKTKGILVVDFLDGVQLTQEEQDILTELQRTDEFLDLDLSLDEQVQMFKEKVRENKKIKGQTKGKETNPKVQSRRENHSLRTDMNKNVYLDGVQLSQQELQLLDQVYKSKGSKHWKQNVDELCETFLALKSQLQSRGAGKSSKASSQSEQSGSKQTNHSQNLRLKSSQ